MLYDVHVNFGDKPKFFSRRYEYHREYGIALFILHPGQYLIMGLMVINRFCARTDGNNFLCVQFQPLTLKSLPDDGFHLQVMAIIFLCDLDSILAFFLGQSACT